MTGGCRLGGPPDQLADQRLFDDVDGAVDVFRGGSAVEDGESEHEALVDDRRAEVNRPVRVHVPRVASGDLTREPAQQDDPRGGGSHERLSVVGPDGGERIRRDRLRSAEDVAFAPVGPQVVEPVMAARNVLGALEIGDCVFVSSDRVVYLTERRQWPDESGVGIAVVFFDQFDTSLIVRDGLDGSALCLVDYCQSSYQRLLGAYAFRFERLRQGHQVLAIS